jgi:hypothetical protein
MYTAGARIDAPSRSWRHPTRKLLSVPLATYGRSYLPHRWSLAFSRSFPTWGIGKREPGRSIPSFHYTVPTGRSHTPRVGRSLPIITVKTRNGQIVVIADILLRLANCHSDVSPSSNHRMDDAAALHGSDREEP